MWSCRTSCRNVQLRPCPNHSRTCAPRTEYTCRLVLYTLTNMNDSEDTLVEYRWAVTITGKLFRWQKVTLLDYMVDDGQVVSLPELLHHTDSYSFCQSWYFPFSCLADGFVCFNAASTSSVYTGSISSFGSGVARPSEPSAWWLSNRSNIFLTFLMAASLQRRRMSDPE